MLEQKGGVERQLSIITKEGIYAMNMPSTHYPMLNNVKDNMSLQQMLTTSGIAGIT